MLPSVTTVCHDFCKYSSTVIAFQQLMSDSDSDSDEDPVPVEA